MQTGVGGQKKCLLDISVTDTQPVYIVYVKTMCLIE